MLCFLKHILRGRSVRRAKRNDSSLSLIMIMKILTKSIWSDNILMNFKAIYFRTFRADAILFCCFFKFLRYNNSLFYIQIWVAPPVIPSLIYEKTVNGAFTFYIVFIRLGTVWILRENKPINRSQEHIKAKVLFPRSYKILL